MNAAQPRTDDRRGAVRTRRQAPNQTRVLDGDELAALIALGRHAVAAKRRLHVTAQELADWLVDAPLDDCALADALLLLALRGLADALDVLQFPPLATARYRLTQVGVAAICQQSAQPATSPAAAPAAPPAPRWLHLVAHARTTR
jgi:hypothetical protein